MPIPPTRYIDAGPGVPQASASAAMAPSLAMAQMGNTIAQVGERGFQIAERVRKVKETGIMSTLFANMEKDAAEFSIELMRRSDTEKWPQDFKARGDKWMKTANESGLSPEAMAEFKNRFTNWNTQRSIGFETMAANKALEMGRAQIDNSFSYHLGQGNLGAALQVVDDGTRSGALSPPEGDKMKMYAQNTQAELEMEEAVLNDPQAVIDASEETLLEQYPGITVKQIRYAKQEAPKQQATIAANKARALEDSIYSDRPPSPEALAADPRLKELKESGFAKAATKLEADLAARFDDKLEAQRKSKPYQKRLMDILNNRVQIVDVKDNMAVWETENMIRQLETGSMKNYLSGELTRRINGEPEDGSPLGVSLRALDIAHKESQVRAWQPAEPAIVADLVNDGFLSETNLKAAGLDEKQIKKVLKDDDGDPRTNTAARFALQNVWKNRADKKAIEKMDPFKIGVFDAIMSNKGTVPYKSVETQQAEAQARWDAMGQWAATKKQLIEWGQSNPKDAQDINKVRAELYKNAGTLRSNLDSLPWDTMLEPEDGTVLPGRNEPPLPDFLENFPNDQ